MLNELRFWLHSAPWYSLRMQPDTRLLQSVAVTEISTQKFGQSEAVTVCFYYPRLRDFVRHVRVFGFPKLYCPTFARLKAFVTP